MRYPLLRRSATCRIVVIVALLLAIGTHRTHASSWPNTTDPNVALSTAADRQDSPRAASDGAGGAIVVWQDLRNQLDWNLFAQRVDAHGNVLWTPDGMSVAGAVFNQTGAQIIADGAAGAIIAWEDTRGGGGVDIYAQRLDPDGNPLWTADGVVVSQAVLDQQAPQLISDGAGGAIIVWEDIRGGAVFDIYAQRIDANGSALWAADGVAISTNVWSRFPALATDGAGGAVIAWEDLRVNPFTGVWAQRVDASGNTQWTANGEVVRSVGWDVMNVHVVPSLANGAIIFWEDAQFADHDIDGSRVIGDGTVMPVFNASVGIGDNRFAHVLSDGANGALVAYLRTVVADDAIAVIRVGTSGPLGTWNGGQSVTLDAPGSLTERNPRVAADASGGAVVVWEDDRYGTPDLFAAAFDNEGVVKWGGTQGSPVTTVVGNQFAPQVIADDNGGGIFVWQDERVSAITDDVYAQRIEGNGYLGYPSPDITTIVDVPQDNGGNVILSWNASELDAFPTQTVTHYSIWRQPNEAALLVTSATSVDRHAAAMPSLADRIGAAVAAGIAPQLAATLAAAGWNFVDTQTATYLGEYSYNAPTYGDSTGAGDATADYMVIAQTTDQFVFWRSAPDSGYSVDNIAPSSPINLVGQTVGSDAQLDWELPEMNGDDIMHYNVYRSQLVGVSPTPGNYLTSVPDLAHLDTTTGGLTHFYVVTGVDLSENESPPSNEVSVPVVSGVGDGTPAFPSALTVLPNSPNPFSDATTLRFGLPANADVNVSVYDVAGRLVFSDRIASAPAGWSSYSFDGRQLPSGIYWFRLSTAGSVQTRKIAITR